MEKKTRKICLYNRKEKKIRKRKESCVKDGKGQKNKRNCL
jgi:hypothetical protein